jgi:DGQHR domain-containing protein
MEKNEHTATRIPQGMHGDSVVEDVSPHQPQQRETDMHQPQPPTQQQVITTSKAITRPASLVRQGNLTLYSTSFRVRDIMLPGFYTIDHLDPENAHEKGYQRLLNKSRAKKLAAYILSGQEDKDAFLPTSVFMATEKNIQFNSWDHTIVISLNETCPLSIVDGQHRVEGLRMAAEKDERVLDFEFPVNIAINLSEIEQMCHFLIVNTTQKTVDEGIAQRIRARLTQKIDIIDTPTLPKWILKSVAKGEDEKALLYIDFLNNDARSPWHGKIRMANADTRDGSINQKSFAKTIKKCILVENNPIPKLEPERQYDIFLNYWIAITNIIGDEEPSVLFKSLGAELFCKFSVPFFNKMVNMPNYTVQTMQSLLESVFGNVEGDAVGVGHADFWVKGGKAGGLNAGAFAKINAEMVKALHSSSSSERKAI